MTTACPNLSAMSADYLSMDSRLASDYDDTADRGRGFTDNELDNDARDQLRCQLSAAPLSPCLQRRSRLPFPLKNDLIWRNHARRGSDSSNGSFNAGPPPLSPPLPSFPLKVKLLFRDEVVPPRGVVGAYDPPSSRGYDSHSSSPASDPPPLPRTLNSFGKAKPLAPPPIAIKPSYNTQDTTRSTAPNTTAFRGPEEPGESPEDPSLKSFLGKIKAFEKMDHFARAQRMLELQEAQNARLEIAQKHPDIYAVPLKTQKLDHSRPQPIGSSSHPEPQTPPSKLPYSESRGFYLSDEEEEYRRQLAEHTKRGYYQVNNQKYQDTEHYTINQKYQDTELDAHTYNQKYQDIEL
ncbi:tight junction protein ZO-2-like [Salvelinus sp. IW2-2015]|uniref:tight junction protein ZO-2-like n=1 Tax=Salvelinus sp. IW2-2015 TaxID=2691554 RepID=UPI0038D393AB